MLVLKRRCLHRFDLKLWWLLQRSYKIATWVALLPNEDKMTWQSKIKSFEARWLKRQFFSSSRWKFIQKMVFQFNKMTFGYLRSKDQKNWNLKGHLFIRQQFLKSAIHWESKAFFILLHVYNINVFKQFLSKKRNEPYWYAKIQTKVFNTTTSFIERPINRSSSL